MESSKGPEIIGRIIAPHFVAGLIFVQGDWDAAAICNKAAPIIKYMLGWEDLEVQLYCEKKGWKLEWVP